MTQALPLSVVIHVGSLSFLTCFLCAKHREMDSHISHSWEPFIPVFTEEEAESQGGSTTCQGRRAGTQPSWQVGPACLPMVGRGMT